MSTDYLCEYHGRASRDTLRVWSGWASTVIHWPHYEPDLGPRYALGRRPRNCRTNLSATAPLDLRASGPTAQIHINGHRGPAPLEPAAGVMSRCCYSADWSLHTAGPDNPDRATRLHLLGPAAIGSGPCRRRRSGVGQSGMDRAEGGDYS